MFRSLARSAALALSLLGLAGPAAEASAGNEPRSRSQMPAAAQAEAPGRSAPPQPAERPDAAWERALVAGRRALRAQLLRDAQREFEAALKKAEEFGAQDVRVANSLSYLAMTYAAQGRPGDAARATARALPILEVAAVPKPRVLGDSLTLLALVQLLYDFQPERALAHFQRTMLVAERSLPAADPVTGLQYAGLAAAYLAISRPTEGRRYLDRALEIGDTLSRRDEAALIQGLLIVVTVFDQQGNLVEADQLVQKVLRIQERVLGPGDREVLRTLQNYAGLLRRMNREAEAEVVDERIRARQGRHRTR